MADAQRAVWMLYTRKADFNRIAEEFHIDPVTARVLTNRGICGQAALEEFFYGTLEQLPDPSLLSGAEQAAELLEMAIREQRPIRVVGDYDIDGVCASYILLMGLRALGAEVDYAIPDRIRDGYGINSRIIEEAHQDGRKVLLTCDNGIAAAEQARLAKSMGMTMIVTDHHEVPLAEGSQVLPPADVVVDPKAEGNVYPFKEICGAVVAWKLVQLLHRRAGLGDELWRSLLPFAAIATVGDVMPLVRENRVIVREGLKAIAITDNPGLRKLMEAARLNADELTPYEIGFVLGPCINAAGRLERADQALELFLERDPDRAEKLAAHLRELNDSRRQMTEEGLSEAVGLVEDKYKQDSVLVVYLPELHESLAGIIAGRLREAYAKPAIVLTRGKDGAKGSGRSIEAYHMFRKLTEVRELLVKFGGHAMAAGMSLRAENIDAFRQALNARCGLTEEDFREKLWIDAPMPVSYVTGELVRDLEKLQPWGQGNERPLFAQKGLFIRQCSVFGKNRNVVRMTLQEPRGYAVQSVWFGDGDRFREEQAGRRYIDILYVPQINVYEGRSSLQMLIRGYRFRDA